MRERFEEYPWVEELAPGEEVIAFRRDLEPYQDELPRLLCRAAFVCAALGLVFPPFACLGFLLAVFLLDSTNSALGRIRCGKLDWRGRSSASQIKATSKKAMVANALALGAFVVGCYSLAVLLKLFEFFGLFDLVSPV